MPPPERRDGDTPKSYAALCDYAGMGPGRSLDKLRQQIGNGSVRRLEMWSSKYDWAARVAAYDAQVAAAAEEDRQAIRAKRRAELEDRDWAEGTALRDRVLELLAEMPRFLRHTESEIRQNGELVKVITLALKAGPGELARALELASKLQRMSVGEPTEKIDGSQAIEIRYVNDPIDHEAPAPGAAQDHARGETDERD